MALSGTVHSVELVLSDADRHVYETLSLRVARHPSEADVYLVARLLAYALEYTDGIGFSRGGLSSPDDPALHVRDRTGALQAWIEVGTPDAARLHRAAKAADRVAVYCHKDPAVWLASLATARIHRADALALHALDRELVGELAARLDRRIRWELAVSGGSLYVTQDGHTLTGTVEPLSVG
jgi:uncharacterized protein YaeQ